MINNNLVVQHPPLVRRRTAAALVVSFLSCAFHLHTLYQLAHCFTDTRRIFLIQIPIVFVNKCNIYYDVKFVYGLPRQFDYTLCRVVLKCKFLATIFIFLQHLPTCYYKVKDWTAANTVIMSTYMGSVSTRKSE